MRTGYSVALLFVCVASAWAQTVAAPTGPSATVITSTRPTGDPRTPVAVPYFYTTPGSEAIGKEMAEVIAYDLDFTGEFLVIHPSQFPPSFTGYPADPTQIDFTPWRKAPAEYLVYASINAQGGNLVGEFRLFDIATGQQLVGKRLAGDKGQARLIAHQFSDEITKHTTGNYGSATSRIVFSSGSVGKKELFVSDYDGANAKQLTRFGSISIKPKISPDGRKIAFVSFKDRFPWLYIIDIASGTVTPLSQRVGSNIAPTWAPDSQSLALALSKDGNLEIYRVNADGSSPRRLTNDRAVDTSPTFSPDGRQIAFISERSGRPQVYVMGADGSNPRRLSLTPGRAFDPVWSPDGSQIAFVAEGGGVNIVVMNADGSNARTVTGGGNNESPSWSPDGHHLIYCQTGGSRLRAVNVNTRIAGDREIVNLRMPCQGPSWGPRR